MIAWDEGWPVWKSGSDASSDSPPKLTSSNATMLPAAGAQPCARPRRGLVRTTTCMARKVGLKAAPRANGSDLQEQADRRAHVSG